jgi:hypothetical protein
METFPIGGLPPEGEHTAEYAAKVSDYIAAFGTAECSKIPGRGTECASGRAY